MKKEVRIDYFDILRGIGILLMIFGHVAYYKAYDYYIHAFHMPLFFFISGYFFKNVQKISFIEFVINLSKKILIPYFVLSAFYILYNCTFISGFNAFFDNLVTVFTTNNYNYPIAGAMWYLTSFYFSEIIFFTIIKSQKKEYAKALISLIVMFAGIYLKKTFNVDIWLSINASLVSIGFLYLGYIAKKFNLNKELIIKNYAVILFVFIFNYLIIMKSGYVNMRISEYPNVLVLLFNLVISIIVYLSISIKISNLKHLKVVKEKLIFIGKYSMIFLCLNQFIIYLCNKILLSTLLSFSTVSFIHSIIIYGISISVLYTISKIIIKTRVKIVFGL